MGVDLGCREGPWVANAVMFSTPHCMPGVGEVGGRFARISVPGRGQAGARR